MDFLLNLIIIIADQLMLFVINILVARHAGEALFGDFTVATNGLLLFSTLITLGMDSIIAYYVPKFYIQKKYTAIFELTGSIKSFLRPIYLIVFSLGFLFSITILALSKSLEKLTLFDITHPLFLFLWGAVVLSTFIIYIQLFRAVNYMRTAVILSLMQTCCYFALSMCIYYYVYPLFFHGNKQYFPHVMLIGFVLSYFICVIIAITIQRHSALQRYKKTNLQRYFAWKGKIYGYTIQNLNKYIFTTIPLMMIEWLGDNEHSVGLFSAVCSIITLAFIAIAPIGVLIAPDISAAFAQSQEALKKVMKKYLWICVAIALVIMSIMGFFAKTILLLYQSNFIDALPYTYACLINVLTFSISMPLSKMIQYSARGSEIGAKLTLYFLLIQLFLSALLIHYFGLKGAVSCYIGINILYNLAMIFLAFKIYHRDPFGETSI